MNNELESLNSSLFISSAILGHKSIESLRF